MFSEFLGKQEIEIVDKIKLNENFIISALPGMGQHTLVRGICETLSTSNFICLNFYPEINKIKDLYEAKIVLDAEASSQCGKNIDEIMTETNKKVLVVLNKVANTPDFELWVKFVESLRKKYFYKITMLATSHFEDSDNLQVPIGTHKIIFKGYKEKHFEHVKSLASYYEVDVSDDQVKQIFNLTLGHAGLNKACVYSIKENKKLEKCDKLLKSEDINNRLSRVFDSLDKAKIDIADFGLVDSIDKFTNVGLCFNKKYGTLFVEYFKKSYINKNQVEQLLSITEANIYKIIEDGGTEHSSVEQIIEKLDGEEDLTDWTIYKHINNINKKLAAINIKIKNTRNKGYIITQGN